ncbi:hypothetical protein CQW23_30913 [Capsicum baccatum]|uniref:Uncharacterized protein n=1 Tax=Capsicum baccatum TaxID=33114 RepID=A0A2G2V991_CAPBA|nr:hypothetical protein CQW23_30913 [Capsicum baccatum]
MARAFESKHGHLLLRRSSRSSIVEPGLAVYYTKGFQRTIKAIERVPNADGDEGYRLLVDAEPMSSIEQHNESKIPDMREPSSGGIHGSLTLHRTDVRSPPPSNLTLTHFPWPAVVISE